MPKTVSLSAIAASAGVSYPVAARWYDDGMPAQLFDPIRFDPTEAVRWLVTAGKISQEWGQVMLGNLGGDNE